MTETTRTLSMKTLYIIAKGMEKPSDQVIRQMENMDQMPRVSTLETVINATVLDERYLSRRVPKWRRMIYKWLPVRLSQIIETLFIYRTYDVVLSHAEPVSLPLAVIKKWFRLKFSYAVTISRVTSMYEHKSNIKKRLIRHSADHIDAILIWSSKQRDLLVNDLDVPAEKVHLIEKGVDHKFWRPLQRNPDMICSVGMEMRDYPTLIQALSGTNIPCHFAIGRSRGELFETVQRVYEHKALPENITVGAKSPVELRDLYARSRFVVVSLLPTDSDNGLTTILESMAMGKAVICSRVEGQVDVIRPGVTGFYVPQGDPVALNHAILDLWNNEPLADAMGRAARVFIEENRTNERYSQAIRNVLMGISDKARAGYVAKELNVGQSQQPQPDPYQHSQSTL